MKNFYLFLGLLAIIVIGLAFNEPKEQQALTELKPNKLFFNEELSAQSTIHGTFGQKHFLNKVSLIFFGYTRCPDFCPDTLAKLSRIHTSLKNNNQDNFDKLQIVFISVDTENDDIVTVKKYIQFFNNDFIGVTLSPNDLKTLTKSIGVYYEKISSSHNIDFYEHTGTVFLVNQSGKLFGIFTPPFDLSKLENEISNFLN
tara:strand:- start:2978 stop:3577 length:600 start_codon:yes stop_codon:yes gene_type:complete